MTKTKVTRRAVAMSFLSLMLCVSMLLGTTFAWFTDSVTSAGNIIKSGTLDVEMKYADGTEEPDAAAWKDASTGAIFNYDLWEPGYTEVRHIQIKNVGTLALKYKVQIVANGTVSDLADVIDVYYMDPAEQVESRSDLAAKTPDYTLTQALAGMDTTAAGNLLAGEAHTITIALKMQEEAGNEYQNKSIGTNFSIQLIATQLTSEVDSFDKLYDDTSVYPVFNVASMNTISDTTSQDLTIEKAGDIESATVPAAAANTLFDEMKDDEAEKNDLTLTLNVAKTGETTTSAGTTVALEIDMTAVMEKTKNNVTTTTTKDVTTFSNYITIEYNLGTGLSGVTATHKGNAMEALASADATPTNDNGGYFYNVATGILTIKTRTLSPFAVSYDNDEIPPLKAMLAAAQSGETVKYALTHDAYIDSMIKVPNGVTLVLNGNGHTLYMNGTTANGASNNTAIRVENGDIVINDLTLAGKARYALYTKGNTAFVNVTLNNVTTDMTSVGMSPIYHNGKANVTLNDCNLGGAGYYDGGYTDGTKILGGAETYFTVNGGYIGVAVVNANEGGAGSIELNNGATADRIFCYTSVNGTNAIVPEVTVSTDSTATEVVYSVKHAVTLKKLTDEGKNVVLSNDITTTDKLTVKNGAYLDGKGYTIDFGGNFNGYVKAIDVLNGSTIKNLHIANAGRAFGADGCNGDIYLDNISGTNAHYFFNGDTPNGSNAYISNSTLDGWISYGNANLFSFDNCVLKGETSRFHGICYFVVYSAAEFKNCTFDNFYMAMNQGAVNSGATGSVVTITNCVYVTSEGTVKVTADNFKSLLMGPGDETDFNRMLNNATIIVDGVIVAN